MKNSLKIINCKRARIKQTLKFALVYLCVIFLFALSAAAQIVSGIVTDAQHSPVRNAQVFLIDNGKEIAQTATDTGGRFSFDAQNAANLALLVKAQGFADFSKTLLVSFAQNIEIILQPQAVRGDVIVSITRSETRLSETPAGIVVLNRETLETSAAQTVDDNLRQVAGFTLFRRSSSKTSNPTTQGANLRGLAGSGASRAAVLLDGFSLNDGFGGWTYWSRVPVIAVEQAEVLRGGASAFYGDQGLSGAVNLQTLKAGEKPVLRFQTSAGTQQTFDASVFAAYGKRGRFFTLAAERFQTTGYIPTAFEERGAIDAKANSRYSNGYLTFEQKIGKQGRIFTRLNIFGERRANGTRLTDNRTYFRQIAAGADTENEKTGTLQFRAFFEKQVYDQSFSAISNNRNTETLSRIQRVPSQSFGANLWWGKSFGAKHFISSSVEFRNDKGFSDETVFAGNRAASLVGAGGNRQTISVFAQDIWRLLPKLNLNIGGRLDFWKNSAALSAARNLSIGQTSAIIFPPRRENAFSPRVAALYQINKNFSLVASYAKSFRAPTLNELYRAFRVGNILTLANENLESECADTFETGVNFSGFSRKINLRGNFFNVEVSRPVVSITQTTAPNLITRQRRNVGKTHAQGIEADAEYNPFFKLKFSASYLFTNSRITDFPANPILINKYLPQVARHQLTFQTLYRPQKKFSLSAQGRISDAQFEDDLNSLRLRPFFTLDAFAAYKFKSFEIFTAIENIFNNQYDTGLTPNRTVAAPRFVRIGLRININK